MTCSHCGETITYLSADGYPAYYLGAGMFDPENAKFYFCNAVCCSVWFKENEDNYQ